MTQRTIYCRSLVPSRLDELTDVLRSLASQLEVHYPTIPRFDVEPIEEMEDRVIGHLHRSMSEPYADPDEHDASLLGKRIFVLCSEDHPFVRAARDENPRAHWGIAVPMTFSVAWVHNHFLWWHEALHLFNAKDCYNKFGINKCPEDRCVMQASPTRESCGGRLHLCSKNQKRLIRDPLL